MGKLKDSERRVLAQTLGALHRGVNGLTVQARRLSDAIECISSGVERGYYEGAEREAAAAAVAAARAVLPDLDRLEASCRIAGTLALGAENSVADQVPAATEAAVVGTALDLRHLVQRKGDGRGEEKTHAGAAGDSGLGQGR
ncbi:MAG TPA: hypothetical protein VM492_13580 [Sumerlaeia bacterium]|nr:hypothetical protein [Sumerlaeia bacterium]